MNLLLHPDPDFCHQLLDSIGIAASLSSVDEDGGFSLIAINDRCRAFYGLEPLTGITPLTVPNMLRLTNAPPTDVEAYVDRMLGNYRHVVATGRQLATETDYVAEANETRWSRNVMAPVYDGERIVRLLATINDVTEIRRTQAAMEKSLASLVSRLIRYCSSCQNVQDDAGNWQTIAEYLSEEDKRSFSHGMCETCAEELNSGTFT